MGAEFKVEMQDTYAITDEKIVITAGGPRGYVFIDVTDGNNSLRIGLKGKRLTKFIKALRHAEASRL